MLASGWSGFGVKKVVQLLNYGFQYISKNFSAFIPGNGVYDGYYVVTLIFETSEMSSGFPTSDS